VIRTRVALSDYCCSACRSLPWRSLLWIRGAFLRGAIIEDNHQQCAGLGGCIGAAGRDLAGHLACVFREDFTECIPLDGDLLPNLDLVLQVDQKLDVPAVGSENDVPAVRDENVSVAACATHWAGNDPVMLEHVHGAFHEQWDHAEIQITWGADLGRERRDARINERVRQQTGVEAKKSPQSGMGAGEQIRGVIQRVTRLNSKKARGGAAIRCDLAEVAPRDRFNKDYPNYSLCRTMWVE
jgi:hypothetical protein